MKNKIIYFFSFFISKASVFIAPLLLSQTMSSSDYGMIEYAIGGLGFLISSLIGFGIPASTGYFLLSEKDYESKEGYNLYLLFLILYLIVVQLLYFVLPLEIYLSFVLSYILANQVFYSYIFKSETKNIYATFIEGGIYFVFLLLILVSRITEVNMNIGDFILPLLVYSGIYVIFGIKNNINLNFKTSLKQLLKIGKYSVHLLLSSFLVILLLNSGRFILEFFTEDYETIAIFGFYLRVSGISLVLFQMLFILYYREIYTRSYLYLDRIFAIFLYVILIYSIGSIYILPKVLINISSFFQETYVTNSSILIILTFFTFFWAVFNIFSNIFVREGLVKYFNYLLVFISLLYVVFLILMPQLNVIQFAVVQFIIGIVTVTAQQIILIKNGYIFKKSIIVIILTILTSILFLANYLI
ncbi:hypothetical protein I215_12383 [Galbibacter marinus]|uniref:Polysaccharide biosynthesis protein n=1 Tax=Galbibacter marinus TaxID=555500 RepID=K2QI70_9FLAO|nr:hypothetical protein [Galbibacter marinus]EKF54427.1 hypothetical protein I215_12383 [Galbibacter marinus]